MNKNRRPGSNSEAAAIHVYGALIVRVSSSRIKLLAAVLPTPKSWRTDMTASSIDVLQAKVHLYSLESEHDRHLWLATDDKQSKRPAKAFFGTLDELRERFNKLQLDGFAIHVCVNAMRGRRRGIAETQRIRALYAEMDREPHKAFPIKPSLIIRTSPGRAHYYWFADHKEPPTVAEARLMLRAIVEQFGADPHAADVTRVLRLAGIWHQKREPHMVRIIGGNGRRYRRETLLAAFPPLQPPSQAAPVVQPKNLDRYTKAAVNAVISELAVAVEGTRNGSLNKAAFRLGQLGLRLDETLATLTPIARSIGLAPTEIRATIRSGHRAGTADRARRSA